MHFLCKYSPENNSPIYSLELLVLEEGIARVMPGEPSRPAKCHAKEIIPRAVDLKVRTACKDTDEGKHVCGLKILDKILHWITPG